MKPGRYPTSLLTVGDHIRTRRLILGLRQRDVAARVGVTTSTVTNWEKGRTSPDLRAMPSVVRFLDYDPTAQPVSSGAAIVRFRRSQGMSQRELAGALRVDPGTLGRWERGLDRPASEVLRRVERATASAERVNSVRAGHASQRQATDLSEMDV